MTDVDILGEKAHQEVVLAHARAGADPGHHTLAFSPKMSAGMID